MPGGRGRRSAAVALLGLLLAGCASFPDTGRQEWREKPESSGELGGPPLAPEREAPAQPPPAGGAPQAGEPARPSGCVDPDPQVVATCLNPVGAIAVLPDGASALVGERSTGRVLRVRRGVEPQLVTTVAVDPGGGGLSGLVLSPGYAEDQLVYAMVATAHDHRVVRIAPGEQAEAVFTGIPRGRAEDGGALGVDVDGSLLVATGAAGRDPADPASLAGKLLRIDTLGHPARGNPDPASPVLASGLLAPAGICVDPGSTRTWVTDRAGPQDVLHLVVPGPLAAPVWTWPDRPGVAGCVARPGVVSVAQTVAGSLFVLHPGENGTFTGAPETMLAGTYGRLTAAAPAPDGLLWLGTANKAGGAPAPSDDRVIRIQAPAGGAASRV